MVSYKLVETYKFFRDTYVDFIYPEDKRRYPPPCCMALYPKYRKLGNFIADINKIFNRNRTRNLWDENNVVGETGMVSSLRAYLQTLWKWGNKNYKENKTVICTEENKCTIREELSVKWRFHYFQVLMLTYKGKAVPLQAWTGPEGSRKLRFPDCVTTAQDGGWLSALGTGRLYPQEIPWYSFLLEAELTPGP